LLWGQVLCPCLVTKYDCKKRLSNNASYEVNVVRITEDLLRKRAEHNNCEIFSLEEISLHQQEIERIELLDKLCRDLKILYLQSNLIPKIENVSRLKKLEYLNLALNNVTRVENLEGCESLQKLDLTVNFIGELTSVESLRGNYHFRELYLTGNPCTEYEGYREYVIATLDSLKWLDGKEIDKSERILAKQDYENIRNKIISQQSDHTKKRLNREQLIVVTMRIGRNKPAKETRFFASDGHVLNINQGKWDFQFDDDEDKNRFVLDLPCFKHLDTSLIDVDVQPTYVRVTVKGKVFQLALSEGVNPDSSSAKRSQTTGHLIISMPKVRQVVKPLKKTSPTKIDPSPSRQKQEAQPSSEPSKHSRIHHERLEVEPNINSDMDFSKIANNSQDKTKQRDSGRVSTISESKEESFVDDPDVEIRHGNRQ
ncbi:hypothetical protein pdam_00015456, partial [Pocillopora damicornis]